jgi:hypothetical protein
LLRPCILDLDTIACFLALQDTKFGPRNIARQPVERLSSRQHVQSASKKPLKSVEDDYINVVPFIMYPEHIEEYVLQLSSVLLLEHEDIYRPC